MLPVEIHPKKGQTRKDKVIYRVPLVTKGEEEQCFHIFAYIF